MLLVVCCITHSIARRLLIDIIIMFVSFLFKSFSIFLNTCQSELFCGKSFSDSQSCKKGEWKNSNGKKWWLINWCSILLRRMKQTWLWLWTFYNSTSTHKVPSWVDSFTSSQKKSSESSTQKKSSTVLAEKQNLLYCKFDVHKMDVDLQ